MNSLPSDRRILRDLALRYEKSLKVIYGSTVDTLRKLGFHVDDLRDFIYRHTLPYCVYSEATGSNQVGYNDIITGAILIYSLPSMSVDIELDGSLPALRHDESIWDQAKYPHMLLRAVYHGVRLIGSYQTGAQLLSSITDASMKVIDAMERDHKIKKDQSQLWVTRGQVDCYWGDPKSRLYGSHITHLMFELSAASAGAVFTSEQKLVSIAIGKLRQLADEHMDVREDIGEGLVTFPVLCSLLDPIVGPRLRGVIDQLWNSENKANVELGDELVELVLEGDGPAYAARLADDLFADASSLARRCFIYPEPVLMLLSLRREQLTRAIEQRLSDPPSGASLPFLLGS